MSENQARGAAPLELPLVNLPSVHPCASCGDCCTYVATQIDDPQSFGDYENLHWYLAHENVSVYIDWEGDWYLEFQTRCKNLTDAKTCAIYRTRPRVCSEFSSDECERNSGEPAYKVLFRSHEDLMRWLEAKRPRAFARYMKKRRALIEARERKTSGRPAPGARARR